MLWATILKFCPLMIYRLWEIDENRINLDRSQGTKILIISEQEKQWLTANER